MGFEAEKNPPILEMADIEQMNGFPLGPENIRPVRKKPVSTPQSARYRAAL
ncbi:MAG: hypothetical protein K6E36_02820 [Oscillospiraceae bacterium]|nr:hypothetical protein [Oscillospiraceae bacterium]